MHLNHQRGETRQTAQNYPYTDAARHRVEQNAANKARRRADKVAAANHDQHGGSQS